MGDDVESRRQFIQQNAKDVRFLDIRSELIHRPDTTDTGPPSTTTQVEQVDLQLEISRSYLDYAMSVIVGRALPEIRDGLKPVPRA